MCTSFQNVKTLKISKSTENSKAFMVLFLWASSYGYCNPLLFWWRTIFGKAKIRRFGEEKISVAQEASRLRQPWAEI